MKGNDIWMRRWQALKPTSQRGLVAYKSSLSTAYKITLDLEHPIILDFTSMCFGIYECTQDLNLDYEFFLSVLYFILSILYFIMQ